MGGGVGGELWRHGGEVGGCWESGAMEGGWGGVVGMIIRGLVNSKSSLN